MKKLLIGLVWMLFGSVLTLVTLSCVFPSFRFGLKHIALHALDDRRTTTIIALALERDGIAPYYVVVGPNASRDLVLGDNVTLAKAKMAAELLNKNGYSAQVQTIPIEGGRQLIFIESSGLPATVLVFGNAWLWLESPHWRNYWAYARKMP